MTDEKPPTDVEGEPVEHPPTPTQHSAGTYITPADVGVSSTWADHRYRNPPSAEPGTDYATGYGTVCRVAEDGTVADLKTSNSGGTGRYVTVNLDDGRRIRYLHLSEVHRGIGERVSRGDSLGLTGASGNGDDWWYGAHVHVTLWARPGLDVADTMDFEPYVGGEDEMTPEQDEMLRNVYHAIFDGGPSMPDGGRSLGQSVADIAYGHRPVVSRSDPDEWGYPEVAEAGAISWLQELADVKTLLLEFRSNVGRIGRGGAAEE